jgi:hypothetical protein
VFDALVQHPLAVALPLVLPSVFGSFLSMLIELVPAFARWWDPLPDAEKKAFRAWAGLALSAVIVAYLHFSRLMALQLASVADWLTLGGAVLVAWVTFVLGAQKTYETTEPHLPRKQRGWSG